MSEPTGTTLYTGRFIDTDTPDPVHTEAAEAMLVQDGKILATGALADMPKAENTIDVGEGFAIPGLIEPHGHPSEAALLLSDLVVDIRPVVVDTADGVMKKIKQGLAKKPQILLANGWDGLLQKGLTTPQIDELDRLAGETPLLIVHNSGHSAYFNSAMAKLAGVTRDTPDPAGASFVRDEKGELTGVALEAAAVMKISLPAMVAAKEQMPHIFMNHLMDLRARGITTVGDLGWDPAMVNPLVDAIRAQTELPVRLRTYEMSKPGATAGVPFVNGDEVCRQVGIKIWSDGSPWVGNIGMSFAYLDTQATRNLGLEAGHIGKANYTTEQMIEIASQYAGEGWQFACHSHGDAAIDSTLDAYEAVIRKFSLNDHRYRIEHAGLMTPEQFKRAYDMGVTVSLFVDHITYWGDTLIDDLFGKEHGSRWADAASAFEAGHRATFHNDGWVTPNEPLRNIAVAETRTSRTGRHLDGARGASRKDTLKAHTSYAAWQLKSEHEVGSFKPGMLADFTVLSVDPRTALPEQLAEAKVITSALSGALSG